MADMARNATKQTSDVSLQAMQMSRNVQTVAAAAQELTAAIRDITRQVTESSTIARQGVDKAKATNHVIAELSRLAQHAYRMWWR